MSRKELIESIEKKAFEYERQYASLRNKRIKLGGQIPSRMEISLRAHVVELRKMLKKTKLTET